MNNKLNTIIKTSKQFLHKHSPEILTGLGIMGMVSSTILAVKVTPKALQLLEYKKEELNTDELNVKEIITTTWKTYMPVLATTIAAGACLIGACTINSKRNAALATAYTLSEKAFSTYKRHVVDTIGERKEKKIRDDIAQENINNQEKSPIIVTSKGNTLCRDAISGRYFRSDLDHIRKITNELNRRMMTENRISLDEYYSNIGLDSIQNGGDMGWDIEHGLIEPQFSACITDGDEPCIVIDIEIIPFDWFKSQKKW